MHIKMHYTPTTTDPTAFHNPSLHTTNKHIAYRRIGLSGAHCYLAHTAYYAHAVFLTKSVDKKRTALVKQRF